jgi:hypothetical protein
MVAILYWCMAVLLMRIAPVWLVLLQKRMGDSLAGNATTAVGYGAPSDTFTINGKTVTFARNFDSRNG